MEELYRHCSLMEVEEIWQGKYQFTKDRTYLAAWLPSAGLKIGQIVTLKGRKELWQVMGIASQEMPRSSLHTDWYNNI